LFALFFVFSPVLFLLLAGIREVLVGYMCIADLLCCLPDNCIDSIYDFLQILQFVYVISLHALKDKSLPVATHGYFSIHVKKKLSIRRSGFYSINGKRSD
jgi:hypothetical protein